MAEDEYAEDMDVVAEVAGATCAQFGSDPELQVDATAWDCKSEEGGEKETPWRQARRERLQAAGPYSCGNILKPTPKLKPMAQRTGLSGTGPSMSSPQFDAGMISEAAEPTPKLTPKLKPMAQRTGLSGTGPSTSSPQFDAEITSEAAEPTPKLKPMAQRTGLSGTGPRTSSPQFDTEMTSEAAEPTPKLTPMAQHTGLSDTGPSTSSPQFDAEMTSGPVKPTSKSRRPSTSSSQLIAEETSQVVKPTPKSRPSAQRTGLSGTGPSTSSPQFDAEETSGPVKPTPKSRPSAQRTELPGTGPSTSSPQFDAEETSGPVKPTPKSRPSAQRTELPGTGPSTSSPQFDAKETSEAAFMVRLAEVPAEYSFATILELHEARQLDTNSMKAATFSRGNWADGKLESCEVLLTYSDAKSAAAVVFALDGQKVAASANKTVRLRVQLISAPGENCLFNSKGKGFKADDEEPPTGISTNGKGKGFKVDDEEPPTRVLYPAVYVSDVPAEYTEKTLTELQKACGINAATIASMQFLPPSRMNAETRSVIVRYLDQDSADRAIEYLHGTGVQVSSGRTKFIGAIASYSSSTV